MLVDTTGIILGPFESLTLNIVEVVQPRPSDTTTVYCPDARPETEELLLVTPVQVKVYAVGLPGVPPVGFKTILPTEREQEEGAMEGLTEMVDGLVVEKVADA